MSREVRSAGEIVKREAAPDAPRKIGGYGAVFSRDANIGEWFIERIAPGAFAKAIERDDIRCLFNHSDNYVIGRNKSGTLRLAEDSKGLAYEADPPDTEWARGLIVSIDRGDISQSSFAFRATKQEWDDTGELPVRTILECELYDVSPVTYPAYDDATVGVRAQALLVEARGQGLIRPGALRDVAARKLAMRMDLDLRTRSTSRL